MMLDILSESDRSAWDTLIGEARAKLKILRLNDITNYAHAVDETERKRARAILAVDAVLRSGKDEGATNRSPQV